MELSREIIEDFHSQISDQTVILRHTIEKLKNNLKQSELFVQVGQIADRLYGAISMFGFKEFSQYCLKMKEMSYKCSNSDPEHEDLREKCFEIVKEFPVSLIGFKQILDKSTDSLVITRKFHLDSKRIDKILVSYLHGISEGSVAYVDVRTYYYVYDKFSIVMAAYKAENREFDPAPKFFNAYGGFKKALGKNPEEIAGIILETQSDGWEGMIKEIRLFLPNVPIALSTKNKRGVEDVDKTKLGVDLILSSHTKYAKVIESFKSIVRDLPSASSAKEENTESRSSDYVSVSPRIFKNGLPSQFDVYIKINDQKFVKVIAANQPFDTLLIEKHIQKNVSQYFILNSDYQKYCADVEAELTRLTSDPGISLAKRKQSLLDHADNLSFFIEENGVDIKTLQSAQKFVEQSEKLIQETIKDQPMLKTFLDDITNLEHSSALCLMCGLFLDSIKATGSIYNDIILLCFFHDIGKTKCSENVRKLKPELLNEEELNQYYTHPRLSAQILAELNFKPALLEAVSQHHVRRSGDGFPRLPKGKGLNPIAELIGLCEDFIITIEESEREGLNPVIEFKMKMKKQYSQKLQDIFNLTFK